MSLGEQLVKLREAKGLSLEELAEETHIGLHVLKELEANDFSRLSAAIYGSGFVKILAKYYGIDAAPLRETFEREYHEWAEERDALPRRKAPPLKFGDVRQVAAATPPPERAKPKLAQKPAAKPVPKPVAEPAPTAAPVPPPVARQHDERADESDRDLFGEPPPRQTPLPPVDDHRRSENRRPEGRRPEGQKPELAEDEDAPSEMLAKARRAFGAFRSRAVRVVRTPTFQRAGVAALVVVVAAWLCVLFVGGNGAPAETAEPSGTPAPVAAAPAPAPAPVAEPPAPAPAPVVEPPVVEPPAPRFAIVGSALTDNLLPPPDCYAD